MKRDYFLQEIIEAVEAHAELDEIQKGTNVMLMESLLAAIRGGDEDHLKKVVHVVENRRDGGNLLDEDEDVAEWMEQFRPKRRSK